MTRVTAKVGVVCCYFCNRVLTVGDAVVWMPVEGQSYRAPLCAACCGAPAERSLGDGCPG